MMKWFASLKTGLKRFHLIIASKMSKQSKIDRKKISFIRSLLRAKSAYRDEEKIWRFSHNNRSVNLPNCEIEQMVSDGIIDLVGEKIAPNSLSKNWLKRKLSNHQEQFSEQHRKIIHKQGGIKYNLNENIIVRLSIAKNGQEPFLLPHHIEAAKRFSFLFEKSHLRQSITIRYNEGAVAGSKRSLNFSNDISDMAIDAREKIEKILAYLPKDCAKVILDVCGFEKGLQKIEKEHGWPSRSAKLVLRIALEQMANYFGIGQMAVGNCGGKSSNWLDEGARPTKIG